jgi:hypothetical protein
MGSNGPAAPLVKAKVFCAPRASGHAGDAACKREYFLQASAFLHSSAQIVAAYEVRRLMDASRVSNDVVSRRNKSASIGRGIELEIISLKDWTLRRMVVVDASKERHERNGSLKFSNARGIPVDLAQEGIDSDYEADEEVRIEDERVISCLELNSARRAGKGSVSDSSIIATVHSRGVVRLWQMGLQALADEEKVVCA